MDGRTDGIAIANTMLAMRALRRAVKSKWSANLSEFNIPGYNIFSNDLSCNSRGIIVYVSQDLARKIVNVNVVFIEFLLVQVTGVCTYNKGMFIGSRSSITENDL